MEKNLSRREWYEHIADTWTRTCQSQIREWPGYESFVLTTYKKDWSTRRVSSRGGWYNGPGINLAMYLFTRPFYKVFRVYEYKSFDHDKVIGGFYGTIDHVELRIAHHVVHEMAHAAQFFNDRVLKNKIDAPHGESFKQPYRELRSRLLNPKIPINQKQLMEEYMATLPKSRF